MNIGFDMELSWSMSEGSDIFVYLCSTETKNEIASAGITFDRLLEESFSMVTDADERKELKNKIRASMEIFLENLDKFPVEIERQKAERPSPLRNSSNCFCCSGEISPPTESSSCSSSE